MQNHDFCLLCMHDMNRMPGRHDTLLLGFAPLALNLHLKELFDALVDLPTTHGT